MVMISCKYWRAALGLSVTAKLLVELSCGFADNNCFVLIVFSQTYVSKLELK